MTRPGGEMLRITTRGGVPSYGAMPGVPGPHTGARRSRASARSPTWFEAKAHCQMFRLSPFLLIVA